MAWRRNRGDQDFDDEIEAHLQLEADRLVEEGMGRDEALAAARRAFGNVTRSRERYYEAGRWMWLERLVRDVRQAWRRMKSSPVSTATIILSLALGIGVNTAIFSLADQALWRALPVRAPEELVQLDWTGSFVGGGEGWGSLLPYPFYRDLREENEIFADMFARTTADVSLAVGDDARRAGAAMVSGSYFPTLGVRPALGRLFDDSDDLERDAHPVVVLSHDYWRGRFGSDPDVVGKQIRMNGYPMKIVGVAEPGFRGMDWSAAPAIWIPMMMRGRATQGDDQLLNRRYRILHGFGRLKPGVSREEAEARLAPWFKAYLQADTEREGWPQVTDQQMEEYMAAGLDLRSGAQGLSRLGRVMRRPMLILLAATGLILLLACLNAANLSLARALSRRRATALRAALGASKGRLLTEQLIESSVLAGAGCLIGLALAPPTARAMLAFLPEQGASGVSLSADLDLAVLLFASGAAVLTTLLSGAAPALHAASVRPAAAIKQQSNAVAGGLGLRKALVVGQFALALVLLIGAGLFSRTLGALRAQGPGYSTTNLAMFRLDPMSDGYIYEQTKPLVRRLLESVRTLPEVEQAGVSLWGMLRGGGWNNFVTVEADQRIATEKSLPMNAVSPGFFETLGAPLIGGRNFDERDSRDDSEWGIRSAIVNEEFVARYLGGTDPIGVRLGFGNGPDAEANIEIVGVVSSFHDFQLREPEAHIYFPAWERGLGGAVFYVRSRSSSEATMRSLRAAVHEDDPKLTIVSMRTVDDQLDRLLSSERMLATLASAFAALATLLASIGLYGVLSFSAERRTKEMGIRIALGARSWSAGGLIVREAAWLALAGAVIALPASWALGRLIESQLFGVRPMDAATIAAAVAALTLVCLGASALPARRAGRADPLDALRSE